MVGGQQDRQAIAEAPLELAEEGAKLEVELAQIFPPSPRIGAVNVADVVERRQRKAEQESTLWLGFGVAVVQGAER